MLCLRVIMSQMFYDIISALHRNVTMGSEGTLFQAEHVCFSFTIKNDSGSEVCTPVGSPRGIGKCYSMSHWLYYYLCIRLAQAQVEVLFEPKRLTGKYSVNCDAES